MSEPISSFVADRTAAWDEVDELVERAKGSVKRLDPSAVRALGRGYRQVAADLAYARRAYPKDPVTGRLEQLAARARPLVYETVRERSSVAHFVTTGTGSACGSGRGCW